MGVLQRFERRIEEMVNRPFARAFKAEVQPVEIASALQRECDDRAAIVARGRTMVPNEFTVALGSHDHERLNVYAEALAGELAAMVREHAEEQRYAFLGPVTVTFERDDELETGTFRVRSTAVAGAVPADAARSAGPTTGAPWLEIGSTTFALTGPVTRIGRGTDTDLRIDDPGVSRNHAEVRREGGDVTIVDAGSTNGVVVDGRRVQQARLSDGASIVLGNTTVVFHAGPR
ncbi:MAG TPA: DUF3662 and FHA domain-containing protein [Actinomycetes bacterium]